MSVEDVAFLDDWETENFEGPLPEGSFELDTTEAKRPCEPCQRASVGDVRERRLAEFRQNVARFRLYRFRFLQENMRFAASFKIYQILKLKFLKFDKIVQILRHLQVFLLKFHENCCFFKPIFLRKY